MRRVQRWWEDLFYFLKCDRVWTTDRHITWKDGQDHATKQAHLCVRNRWHSGPHRDRLGLHDYS